MGIVSRQPYEEQASEILLAEARNFKRAIRAGRTTEERHLLWLETASHRNRYPPGLSLYLLVGSEKDLPVELRSEQVEMSGPVLHYGLNAIGSYEFDRAWYLRWKRVSDVRMSTLLGLMANQVTQTPSVALTATVIAAFWNNIKRLSEEETFVLRTMQRLTENDVYKRWISQDDLIQALPDDTHPTKWLDLLASMQSRGILEDSGGLWRAVK